MSDWLSMMLVATNNVTTPTRLNLKLTFHNFGLTKKNDFANNPTQPPISGSDMTHHQNWYVFIQRRNVDVGAALTVS